MWPLPYVVFFGACILLLVIAYFAVVFIVTIPILCLWFWLLPKMVNLMGRHTTNRFTREFASTWIIAGLPIPFIAMVFLISPKAMWILFGIDLVLWFLLAVFLTISSWKEPLEPWEDMW